MNRVVVCSNVMTSHFQRFIDSLKLVASFSFFFMNIRLRYEGNDSNQGMNDKELSTSAPFLTAKEQFNKGLSGFVCVSVYKVEIIL